MAAPSPRNPIRPARGNFVDLKVHLSDLYEGELCYAVDQDRMYVVDNGQLVPVGSGAAPGSSVLTTEVLNPQPGQSLNYDGAKWVNGGVQDGGAF